MTRILVVDDGYRAISILVIAACSSPAKPASRPPAAPAPIVAKIAAPPSHLCKAITPRCDHTIDDDAVFKLVRHRCWACHGTDGIANHDFPDLAALRTAPVAEMIGTCQMPPDGSPLGETDRQMLVEWATCQK